MRRYSTRTQFFMAALLLVGWLVMPPASLQAAQVTWLEGSAQVRRAGESDWSRLAVGDVVREMDAVRTGSAGRVEITFSPRRQARLGPASQVVLHRLRGQGPFNAGLDLVFGRLWASLRAGLNEGRGERFSITTPTSTVGVKGTRFGVDFDPLSQAGRVAVIDGQVAVASRPRELGPPRQVPGPREIAPPQEVTREQWTRLVSGGEKLILRPGEVPQVSPLSQAERDEPWVRWNLQRDQL